MPVTPVEAMILAKFDRLESKMDLTLASKDQAGEALEEAVEEAGDDEPPAEFIRQPRNAQGKVRNAKIADVDAAILALFNMDNSTKMLKMARLDNHVEAAIKQMISIAVRKGTAGQPWSSQDHGVTSSITKLFTESVSKGDPWIPIEQCENNWMARFLLLQKWSNAAKKKSGGVATDDAQSDSRRRKRKYATYNEGSNSSRDDKPRRKYRIHTDVNSGDEGKLDEAVIDDDKWKIGPTNEYSLSDYLFEYRGSIDLNNKQKHKQLSMARMMVMHHIFYFPKDSEVSCIRDLEDNYIDTVYEQIPQEAEDTLVKSLKRRPIKKKSKNIGCKAQLMVYCYEDDEDNVEFTYVNNYDGHIPGSIGDVQYLRKSKELNDRILEELHKGYHVRDIKRFLQREYQHVAKSSRFGHINTVDVYNILCKYREELCCLDKDDFKSNAADKTKGNVIKKMESRGNLQFNIDPKLVPKKEWKRNTYEQSKIPKKTKKSSE
ncbi:hypothetical protein INT45_004071 [Circinella minor]|uniref:Uncharacterized protein n=1 Tax=Circinella minor TaxID=1195481 RepID=A0A8H7VKI3_9FUNG|nr:hypothetical protein INT45_004071 [Circinella minor]